MTDQNKNLNLNYASTNVERYNSTKTNNSLSNENIQLFGKTFFSKLRILTNHNEIIKHFVESLYKLTKLNIIYLNYHKTHSLLGLAYYKGNIEFKYKVGIKCNHEQAYKIILKNELPPLDSLKCLTTYEAKPIAYNNNLYGVVIFDGIKNADRTLKVGYQFIPHFAAFVHAFKQANFNKKMIDPYTDFYTKKHFYKTLYEVFDKTVGLILIRTPNIKAMEQIDHKIYRLKEKEFAIIVNNDLTDTAFEAEKIRRSLLTKGAKASIGVSSYPETCHDADSLLYTAQYASLAVKNKVCIPKTVLPKKKLGKEIHL